MPRPEVLDAEEEEGGTPMRAYPVMNAGLYMGGNAPPPPGICCQATQDGGVICSDGTGFPPG